MLSIYFAVALMAIVSLILTVRPRIRLVEEETGDTDKTAACEPAFFVGICKFPTLSAYRQALEDMIKDESSTINVYTKQIFSLARINAAKYKNIQRAVLLVIIALAVELALVAYLFIYYHAQGASMLPPLFRLGFGVFSTRLLSKIGVSPLEMRPFFASPPQNKGDKGGYSQHPGAGC